MKFNAVLELSGKSATGIEVPEHVVTALGKGKRPPVRVTINGYSYRTTVATMQGRFMLPVSAEHRAGAGIAPGEDIVIAIEPDNEPREVKVPADFAAVLEENRVAQEVFYKMSYSHQLQHVLAIEGAKTAETRQRRIEKAVAMLLAAKK